jgi:hypothetical protein
MPTWGWIFRGRRERRQQVEIRELSAAARDRYESELRSVRMRFVDDPSRAVREADRLVQQVMSECGYPVEDFERRAADVSVDHPQLVKHYRSAHAVWAANERGEASTEELRKGLVHYRLVFDELLGVGEADEPLSRDTAPDRKGVETEARS